jgi:ketosteroid isomerase-like protein
MARSGILGEVTAPNSELLLAGYEAWNRDDLDAWIELLHPDVEIHTSGVFPDLAPVYRGHQAAARFWRQMHEPWERFRIDVEQVEDVEDGAIAAIRFRAKGVDSGVEVDMRFGMAMTVSEGVAIALLNRATFEEARQVATVDAQPSPHAAR